ncbi:heavy-metal-associated domain-containing protein [Thioclava sp. BHET1]|nr:heavy-metal-associated domain-containing protein [Thioclava sp. BHET1]
MSQKLIFSVPDMSCGHCKASIQEAIAGVDAGARVAVDLESRKVEVESSATPEALQSALKEVGYPSERL